jgi:hypothetical protein
MLGAIHKGRVPAYSGGQRDVVYLVAYAETVASEVPNCCFTNGHAVEAVTNFYSDLKDLSLVDMVAVETWRWGGKWLLNDPDIMRRKQAEFLVHQKFPWRLVARLGVLDTTMLAQVREIIAGTTHRPGVTIQPKWYYNL